ncbi:PR domain zinc finger protein 13 [Mactra antiquata]
MCDNLHDYKVQASTFIPCDSYFGPIYQQHFQELTNRRMNERSVERTVIEMTVLNKVLLSRTQTSKPWYLYLNIARDIFEQNLQLHKSRDGHVYIRCTKTIQEGDEMKYWFDDNLIREMNITHLTPANIIGICRYTCHVCGKEFMHPNPLKLHIMDHQRGDTNEPVMSAFSWLPKHPSAFSKVSQCDNFQKPNISPEATNNGSDHVTVKHDGNLTPKMNLTPSHVFVNGVQSLPRYTLKASIELIPSSGCSPGQIVPYLHNQEKYESKMCEKIKLEEQSMESFSMDSPKKGHLCVFCGKLYSRKYGLKIHLRTHTGYKPLRCKYCYRAFGDPSNLNKHIRLHAQGTTPYQCTYCNKVLVRRRDLVRHLKSRHSDEVTNS